MPVEARFGGHWLTLAVPRREPDEVLELMGGAHSPVESVGGYGHPRSVVHETGARVYFGGRDVQPVVVNLGGDVCESWYGLGVEWAERLGAYVTRHDAACDVEPPELARGRMRELHREWKRGRCVTRIRTFEEHRSDNGWTWYFGGREAELRLRCYDKRGFLRLEFQHRPHRDVGMKIPEVAARCGVAALWRSNARAIAFPELGWWNELTAGAAIDLGKAPPGESLFMKVVEQLRLQLGVSLWGLEQLGVTIADLATPPENIRGDVAAKLLRWADESETEGYDGSKLREEIRCRLKSQRASE